MGTNHFFFSLWKPSSFATLKVFVGLQYFFVHYVFSVITSIISLPLQFTFIFYSIMVLLCLRIFSALIIIVAVIV